MRSAAACLRKELEGATEVGAARNKTCCWISQLMMNSGPVYRSCGARPSAGNMSRGKVAITLRFRSCAADRLRAAAAQHQRLHLLRISQR